MSRALNTERLIAFVGSGLSAAYGRVTWSALAELHLNKLFSLVGDASERLHPRDTRRRIFDQLRYFRDSSQNLRDRTVLVLQLCEQIWCLTPTEDPNLSLTLLCESFFDDTVFDRFKQRYPSQPRLGRELFRYWVKRETFDETTNVARILSGFGENTIEDEIKLVETLPRQAYPKGGREERGPEKFLKILRALNPNRELHRSRVEIQTRPYVHLFSKHALNRLKTRIANAVKREAGSSQRAFPEFRRRDSR